MAIPDPWLERWLPLVKQRAGAAPVLEIGCGAGDDTVTLLGAGLRVVGFDLSPEAVAAARERAPEARLSVQDARDPWPLADGAGHVAVASLSLHYFPWRVTCELVDRVRRFVGPGGLFLCRLNSTADVNYGATGHDEIEPHLYLVGGHPKRFFDAADLDRLFADGWRERSRRHMATRKYGVEKRLWEVVLDAGGE
jgi:SAM-dependent methyltransferase